MAAAGQAVAVPKFGSWDAENISYTVFFEKVRDNKGPPPPAAAPKAAPAGHDFDPYEHYENLSRMVPSRPPSSHGGHAPAPRVHGGGAYDDYDPYDSMSSRNAPSRPPSSHGHGPAAPAAAAPPRARGGAGYDYDPYEHCEDLSGGRNNVPPPSRPPNSHGGHAPPQHRGGSNGYHHRRTGSNGSSASAASEASSRASKFSPPRPYQPRYTNNNQHHRNQEPQAYGNGHAGYHPQGAPSSAGYRSYASPSPPRGPPPPLRCPKAPSAVPRFGVWDEQNAATAAQGFTVQFEKVKRHREEAKAAAAPPVPPPQRMPPDDQHAPAPAPAQSHGKERNKSFLSKVYRCLFPVVRE